MGYAWLPLDPSHKSDPARPATFAPHQSGVWPDLVLQYCFALVVVVVPLFVLVQPAVAQEFKSGADCVVGKRVVTREKQAGVIVKAEGSSCQVKLDSTGKIDYNIFWMLRAEAGANKSGKASPAAGTSPSDTSDLPAGKYACYMLSGTTLNYMFIDIHIESGGRYRDGSGKSGVYTIGADDKISFTGPLTNANGKLLPGPRIGLNMSGGSFYNTTCSHAS